MVDASEKNKHSERPKTPEKPKPLGKIKDWSGGAVRSAERYLPDWMAALWTPRWRRWSLMLATSVLCAVMMAPKWTRVSALAVGEPAAETIISPITFKVIDEEATKKNQDEVAASVRLVYDFDDEMVHDVQSRIAAAFNFMRDYLASEAQNRSEQENTAREGSPATDKKSSDTKPFRPLDDQTLRTRFEYFLGAHVPESAFETLKTKGFNPQIERDLRSLIVRILVKGVILSRDLVMRDGRPGILLYIKSKEKLEPLKDLSALLDIKEAMVLIEEEEQDTTRDSETSQAISRVARALVTVNITYNRERSMALKKEARASVKSVFFQIGKGEPIIREGEPVNEGHLRKLEGLINAQPAASWYLIVAGMSALLFLLLHLSLYFAEHHLNRPVHCTEDLWLICLLLVGTLILVKGMSQISLRLAGSGEGMSPRLLLYAAPVATGAMLVALMVEARTAFLFAALAAAVGSIAVEGDIYLFMYYFISGMVGLLGMSRITDRTSVLRASLVLAIVNMMAIAAVMMAEGHLTGAQDAYGIGLGFLGGVISGLLVFGLSPIVERLGYTTNIRLLEIANLNHPLLKEMALEAPGTCHHSIMVGNLAETTAELIGANPLLARAGALYHDIGKIGRKTKPTYFIENQGRSLNPHDKLEPSMSALILVTHVKNGVEKGLEYRLGQPIIDIIQQHHGSSLIRYFYNKALEKAEKSHQTVSEDKYRYPGPRPQTKEAALVMLADVAEAACRTLADPTPARIQKRVQTLIMQLFSEGQLDQSTLTLKDLHAITKSFVRTLQGSFHSRIEYPPEQRPQERANGNTHRQPSDKDRPRPPRHPDENGASIRRLGLS